MLKSKMKSGRHIDNFAFEPPVLEYCVIPLLGVQICIESICDVIVFKSRSSARSNVKYRSITNEKLLHAIFVSMSLYA